MQSSVRQCRVRNCTCSFEFVPIPSSEIAVRFNGLNPACEMSTERRIENGIASATRSAVTVREEFACRNVSVYVPDVLTRIATSSDSERYLTRERIREPGRNLVVAAADVVLLVRLAEADEYIAVFEELAQDLTGSD